MFSQKVLCLFIAATASVSAIGFDPTKTMQPGVPGYEEFVREIEEASLNRQQSLGDFDQHDFGNNRNSQFRGDNDGQNFNF